jgi:transposase
MAPLLGTTTSQLWRNATPGASIEMAFAKLKAHLRAKSIRTIDALWQAIGDICNLFSPTECRNYFNAAGYGLT